MGLCDGATKGVCIVNSDHESGVDHVEIRRQGWKFRSSPTCLPDLLVTGSGSAVAFIALDGSRSTKQLQNSGLWERW